MRICELITVMMWFGPTAPALSGVNALPSPNKPRKLAEAGGEEVDEKVVAENELVETRVAEANDIVLRAELEVDAVELSVVEVVAV